MSILFLLSVLCSADFSGLSAANSLGIYIYLCSFNDYFNDYLRVGSLVGYLWGTYSALGPSWPRSCHIFSKLV